MKSIEKKIYVGGEKINKVLKLFLYISFIFWVFSSIVVIIAVFQNLAQFSNLFFVFLYLFFCCLIVALFTLPPAYTVIYVTKKIKKKVSRSRMKSTMMIFLTLFLGFTGIQRFLTKKKFSGFIYLLTFGCLGVGWFLDLYLMIFGLFPDGRNRIICSKFFWEYYSLNEINDDEAETITLTEANDNDSESEIEDKKDYQNLYSEIEMAGTEEKKETIPIRNVGMDISNRFGELISNFPETEEKQEDLSVSIITMEDRFFQDAKQYHDRVVQKAVSVPMAGYYPTFERMSSDQKNWYFYWRGLVRKETYLETDISYIFVYIYELINDVEKNDPVNTLDSLMKIWTAYREIYSNLDIYLLSWGFDYAYMHKLSFDVSKISDLKISGDDALKNSLFALSICNNSHLKMPFSVIEMICNYKIKNSRFFNNGYAMILEDAIPRCISLTDQYLRKKNGQGIIEIYGPKSLSRFRHDLFQGAVYRGEKTEITISVKPYISCEKLQNFFDMIVKYSENSLREIFDFNGRLRGISLDNDLEKLLDKFLSQTYRRTEKISESQKSLKTRKVTLNFDDIDLLRKQSDEVREALEVNESENKPEISSGELYDFIVNQPSVMIDILKKASTSKFKWEIPEIYRDDAEKLNRDFEKRFAVSLIFSQNGKQRIADEYHADLMGILEHLGRNTKKESNDIQQISKDEKNKDFNQFIDSLSDSQKKTLKIIASSENVSNDLNRYSEETFSMPEMLIDEVNESAEEFFDDLIIDTSDVEPKIFEQYFKQVKMLIDRGGLSDGKN